MDTKFPTAGLEELMGVMEPEPALGARGGRQGWCGGEGGMAVLAEAVASGFCSGP